MILLTIDKNKNFKVINNPVLPNNEVEFVVKKFNSSNFNLNNSRYNFQENFNKRTKFRINYSYYPYTQISKKNSFDENAMKIYIETGMLNFTKLEYAYNKDKYNIDIANMNEIHLSMAFDKEYSDLALISIASVLNSSNSDTFIHFHVLALNFGLNEIKKIINLRKINFRVEFIFYNAKQVEYDFDRAKNEMRKYGNYAKILSPEIVNNTNKILILDSGDIIVQKDLSEIYFYDLKDNYFGWTLEICAGYYLENTDKFKTNNFHPNAGVVLVNIRLFRKDELYKKAVFVGKSYHYFECPVQDILITIANYKFSFFPLNYNLVLYYENKNDSLNRKMIPSIRVWQKIQRFSPYKYTFDEIVDAMIDPVVQHFYLEKLQETKRCNKYVYQWLKYANVTGRYLQLKQKYKIPFLCEKIFGLI